MPFIKGHKTNVGRKCSVNTRTKISHANKGKTRTVEMRKNMSLYKKGCVGFFKGRKHSKETKEKISQSKKGTIVWNKGLKGCMVSGKNHHWYGSNKSGSNNPYYVHDRTKLKKDDREYLSSAYMTWCKGIKNRDNWKCKINNNECKGRLESHHILSWRDYPELRYDINNGITLCLAHHPRKRAEEKRLIPEFQALVSVSKN